MLSQSLWQDGSMQQSRAAQQRALYGTTLAERFGSIMQVYQLSQRSLAEVLGLSAPMLSQLISAQRIKIGNPAVYERLVMLENRVGESDRATVLSEVRASQPVLSSQRAATIALDAALSRLATPEQLATVARTARHAGAPLLAEVLSAASRVTPPST